MREGMQGGKTLTHEALSLEEALGYLEDMEYVCPCCDTTFSDRHVRLNKLTPLGFDSDLRPLFSPLDPILYDIVICKKCGYSALVKTFDNLSFKNAQIIMSSLPQKYKNVAYPLVYSADIAIKRYQAAILNALLIREKSSVIAYMYMRLAWIYRSKGDTQTEKRMLAASFEGFLEATRKEAFPIIDMDEATAYYVMGDFLCRLSKEKAAKCFFDKALSAKGLDSGIKQRIMERPLMKGQNEFD